MARYRESVCKLCRNEGVKLFLKGERCDTPKCAIERRSYGSGQHGQARKKLSEYAIQLREKQKVRRLYGMLEKPFRQTFRDASHKKGTTGTVFLQLLESRFDNIIYRSGIVSSRAQGRQWIGHGHFLINGKRVDIPSYKLRLGDIITPAPNSLAFMRQTLESRNASPKPPHWLEVDLNNLSLRFASVPNREDFDPNIKEQLIIEYYSR
ncbi:MAG: 30S ribosomal protein S4 [Candidatus Melainabacteria bacterium]|nr:30S ribosomal protein S4 [Candidatus Melainabacteria bacterium]